MDIDLRNALSGLLLLHGGDDSINDNKDGGTTTTPTNNDSDAIPTSGRGDSTPISNNSTDATPTSHEGNDSNNDSEDSGTTPTNNDSDVTPTTSSRGNSNDSMDGTPTSPTMETKRRKYKKRGGTSFIQTKASNKAKYSYQATVKPRAAKKNANVAISSLSKDTCTFENDSVLMKLCEEDVRKLIHLFYVKIGCPPPEDWHGAGGTISETIKNAGKWSKS